MKYTSVIGSAIIDVYFNGDLENPSVFKTNTSQTFERWITTLKVVPRNNFSTVPILIEYDVVPVEYLPPKQRRAL